MKGIAFRGSKIYVTFISTLNVQSVTRYELKITYTRDFYIISHINQFYNNTC